MRPGFEGEIRHITAHEGCIDRWGREKGENIYEFSFSRSMAWDIIQNLQEQLRTLTGGPFITLTFYEDRNKEEEDVSRG